MIKTLLFFLIVNFLLFCQTGSYSDSLFSLWKKSSGAETEKLEEKLILRMYTAPYDSAKALSDKLLRETSGLKNNSLYIKALTHSYRFYIFKDKIKLLNEAEALAEDENDRRLLSGVYLFKTIAFRDNSMTDSAMMYALKTKDLLESFALESELAGILQLIADLHYYAGQYDEAEKTYRRILSQKTIDPNHWRINTIYNNIGLIRIKQHRYAEAELIFKQSLGRLFSRKMNYADSSGLPYLYRKLMEVTLHQDKNKEAESYFIIGEYLSERFRQRTELPGLYALKGALCYKSGYPDSALYYYKKAEVLNRDFPDFGNQINIYEGLSNTYSLLNNNKKANDYLRLLIDVKNKSDSAFYRARYMNAFAEYNYNNYLKEIKHYKNQQLYLLIIIFVVTLSLIIIVYFYIKINLANKKLVQKNIEAVEGFSPHILSEKISNEINNKTSLESDDIKIRTIIKQLENLMTIGKLYLEKDISLGKIAEMLSTNRCYLSKAINTAYGVNFNTYINDLRIKEAIHLISSGAVQHLNMEGIAEKCGFNNRVSFTNTFQKFTGVSPSFFIKNAEKIYSSWQAS